MALRRGAVMMAEEASGLGREVGMKGFLERLRLAFTRGLIVRQDVSEDVLRRPVEETKWRFPSPGSQTPPVVPQGPYENVFDIAYYKRDVRRSSKRAEVEVEEAAKPDLPPTPGSVPQSTHLGYAGEFDVKR